MVRQPKAKNQPAIQKESRRRPYHDPSSTNSQTIVWKLGNLDKGGEWSFRGISDQEWWNDILPKLKGFESMTWAAIMSAVGGKSKGTNSHPVKYENLSRNAQKRLKEIGQNDVSELFSLRLSGTKRIYGIRDGRALKLIWYDRDHGDATKAVCPSSKR